MVSGLRKTNPEGAKPSGALPTQEEYQAAVRKGNQYISHDISEK